MDPERDARRLLNDPEHLRRKAAYIESLIVPGTRSALNEIRMNRVQELRNQADRLAFEEGT
jgi:hypothetical protein